MTPKWPVKTVKQLLEPFGIDAPAIEIQDVVLDSRKVAIHKAFLAIKGHELDGRDFIPQAISLGAKVIIAECDNAAEHGETEMREMSVIIKFYQLAAQLSQLAEGFFDSPSQQLKTVAVTGTNGKTSTAHFVAQLGELLGERSALVGTLGAGFPDSMQKTANTTPDAITMHRILADVRAEGAKAVAFEASSHALVQNRIRHLHTDVAVFTNLTRDHLDYHGSMEDYAKAKRLLLNQPGLQKAVLNMGDPEYKNWLANLPEKVLPVLFGIDEQKPALGDYCIAKNLDYNASGVTFDLHSSWGNAKVQCALLGHFNVANLLGAIAAQLSLGADFESLTVAVSKVRPVPGRMELFEHAKTATFVVDYAHTPDALENVLIAIKRHAPGKLWCVFGCGGERDHGKRPMMGKVAETNADRVVLTSDNSRGESTDAIIQDILSGVSSQFSQSDDLYIVPERTDAVKAAMKQAATDDVVVLAGKGHEDYQIVNGQKTSYDEREYLQTLLSEVEQ